MSESFPPSQGPSSRRRALLRNWIDAASGIIVSTSLAALCIVLADRFFRPDWDFSWADHWKGAPVLYLAPAALVGLLWANVKLVQEGVSWSFRKAPRRRDWIRALVVAVIAAWGAHPTAELTFSGAKVSKTWLGEFGPLLFVALVFFVVLGLSLLLWRMQRRVALGRRRVALLVGGGFVGLACVALWIDMNVYVGLYEHLHAFLELSAFGFFVAAFQLFGFALVRALPRVSRMTRGLALGLVLLGVTFVTYRPLRTWTDSRLAHAWVDEYYVGRALRRAQLVELELTSDKSLRVARVEHLARRFQLENRSLDPNYLRPTELEEGERKVRNFLFFYVDTLRADVAADETLMPSLSKLRAQSMDFERAYATGSDTLRSLPTILSGNYFLDHTHRGGILRLARESGHHRRLVVAKSAHEFLSELMPVFAFDQVDAVPDVEDGEKVWGYGAHLSTARGVGDGAENFLRSAAAKEPFFLWLFHFDAHAWRELDDEYIKETQARLGIPAKGTHNLRYRVVARAIDEQLGRVLRVLKETGRDKDTAVVFLSDHGEGLGQGGFWVHSIFLWESLMRVPLVMRMPGVTPARISTPVSLVDLAPTLAVSLGAQSAVYHGDDLVQVAAGKPRRFPILMRGGKYQGHDRIGIVDPSRRRKLVIRLEAAFPELIAYETDPLDEDNLARKEPGVVAAMLAPLARSPVFPRAEADFELSFEPTELEPQARLDAPVEAAESRVQ